MLATASASPPPEGVREEIGEGRAGNSYLRDPALTPASLDRNNPWRNQPRRPSLYGRGTEIVRAYRIAPALAVFPEFEPARHIHPSGRLAGQQVIPCQEGTVLGHLRRPRQPIPPLLDIIDQTPLAHSVGRVLNHRVAVTEEGVGVAPGLLSDPPGPPIVQILTVEPPAVSHGSLQTMPETGRDHSSTG